jgi:hypothetical protein
MKRIATSLLILVALGILAAAAYAGPPLPGDYKSTDVGGTLPAGRYTEGWDAGGSALGVGTTQNCASWNGAALGTVWQYTCGTQLAPSALIANTVNAQGNGYKIYASTYVGGTFWLSGTGPWANGDAAYPGAFDSYVEYETVLYSNWVPYHAITNVSASAHFDNYPADCMGFSIGNGARIGTTDLGNVMPANYPAMLDASCNATRSLGAWWDFLSLGITITSDCVVKVTPSTWGAVKAIYR